MIDRPRSLIVFNPASGKGRSAARALELRARLEASGREVEVLLTEIEANVLERVDEARYSEVFVVGGDGSAHAAANGLSEGRLPVVFCGTGTINVLALEQRLPRDPAGLVAVALDGRDVRARLLRVHAGEAGEEAQVNGLLFVEAGFLGRVVSEVNAWRKRHARHGKLEFVMRALEIVPRSFGRPMRATLETLEGERREAAYSNVIASKVRRYAGSMPLPIPEGTPMEDEGFWVMGMRTRTPFGHLALLALGALGAWPRLARLLEGRAYDLFRARSLRVEATKGDGRGVHVDAESPPPGGRERRLPIVVEEAGASLCLRVPRP